MVSIIGTENRDWDSGRTATTSARNISDSTQNPFLQLLYRNQVLLVVQDVDRVEPVANREQYSSRRRIRRSGNGRESVTRDVWDPGGIEDLRCGSLEPNTW